MKRYSEFGIKSKTGVILKKLLEICGFDETRCHMSELARKTRSRLRTGMRTMKRTMPGEQVVLFVDVCLL